MVDESDVTAEDGNDKVGDQLYMKLSRSDRKVFIEPAYRAY